MSIVKGKVVDWDGMQYRPQPLRAFVQSIGYRQLLVKVGDENQNCAQIYLAKAYSGYEAIKEDVLPGGTDKSTASDAEACRGDRDDQGCSET